MGFYLRKSFRAGPIRFNLSKSGIGASVGVTGARVGLSPGGRAYVHGGRGGLYYRKSLGGGRGRAQDAAAEDGGPARRVSAGAIELTEDTGVTYGAVREQEQTPGAVPEPLRPPAPLYGWLALVVVAGIVGIGAAALLLPSPWPGVAAAAVVAAVVVLGAAARKQTAAGDAYGRLLDERAVSAEPATGEERTAIGAARADPRLTDADARYFGKRAYRTLLEKAVTDGADDPGVFERLAELETLAGLDPAFGRQARLDAYSRAHVEAVSDHDLTEAEEQALDRARTALGLSDEDVADELALIDRLRELRAIRGGDLPVVDAAAKLSSREVCHLESEGRLLKRRLLRSFSRDGQRYKVRGYVIDKEGALLVTSRRVALIHRGVTSFPIGKILDVEVDHDRQLLILTRDDVATPAYVTTPDALRAGALVAALTEGR